MEQTTGDKEETEVVMDTEKEMIEAVSYTHLDVYKRQVQVCFGVYGFLKFFKIYNGNVLRICLLYTSRCV